MEVWKPVVGYEGLYAVSTEGRVMHVASRWCKSNRFKRSFISNAGYLRVSLSKVSDGKQRVVKATVHRLVAEAFIGPCHEVNTVNHRDGNKLNNALENLEYATQRDNQLHAYQNGLQKRQQGSSRPMAKLTEDQVRYIRHRHAKGESQRSLAREYGVCDMLINGIVHYKKWKHI